MAQCISPETQAEHSTPRSTCLTRFEISFQILKTYIIVIILSCKMMNSYSMNLISTVQEHKKLSSHWYNFAFTVNRLGANIPSAPKAEPKPSNPEPVSILFRYF